MNIYDLQGKLIRKIFFRGDHCRFNTTGLTAGLYIYSAEVDNIKIGYGKLIIN
ncbi:MAG: hypothetical protein ACHQFW_09780 [Chitinophagales bacterium]